MRRRAGSPGFADFLLWLQSRTQSPGAFWSAGERRRDSGIMDLNFFVLIGRLHNNGSPRLEGDSKSKTSFSAVCFFYLRNI